MALRGSIIGGAGTRQYAMPGFSPHRSAVLGIYVVVGALG